jgi:hypothetical protein
VIDFLVPIPDPRLPGSLHVLLGLPGSLPGLGLTGLGLYVSAWVVDIAMGTRRTNVPPIPVLLV